MAGLFKSKIFLRHFLGSVTLICFTFVIISFVLLTVTRISLEKQQLYTAENYRIQASKAITDWLTSTDLHLKSQAAYIALLEEEKIGSDEVAEIIKNEIAVNDNLLDILILNQEGEVVNSVDGPKNKYTLPDRLYFINGMKGEATITGFYKGAKTGIPIMAIGHPIFIDGKPKYVIAGIIGLERIKELVENQNFGYWGQAYLVDPQGRFITDSRFIEEYVKGIGDKEKYIVYSKAVQEVLTKKEGTGIYNDFLGQRVFGSYQWFEQLQVGLIVEFGAERAMAPVSELLRVIGLLSIAVAVIGICMAFIFSKQLVRPINHLVDATEDIIRQNYNKKIEFATGTELDMLADRFNSMQSAIRCREDRLKELSMKDGLTGIYNHALLIELFEKEFENCNETGKNISFIMLDIDYFKKINDTYGHVAGDIVLKEFASMLKECMRDIGIVGRYGGEEFSIVMPEADSKDVIEVCETIRQKIEGNIFNAAGTIINATTSIGICHKEAQQKSINSEDMIKMADNALYMAKGNGRNRVEVYRVNSE
ncbi:GGDEF domain-containing protein [Petroclostridium sp. X23]|uniref:sensor domain-containing diguanylate cyclase n=1 Tax=Petroclostridium sp. X23 TaxID=3045146 RepID=UPI0024AE0229|nr:GGDEF domain-containing protein [Petroclostridium sp. X23]WHH57008.1 GGDEF domain-containing protein [Petroclostridium sp. X23]